MDHKALVERDKKNRAEFEKALVLGGARLVGSLAPNWVNKEDLRTNVRDASFAFKVEGYEPIVVRVGKELQFPGFTTTFDVQHHGKMLDKDTTRLVEYALVLREVAYFVERLREFSVPFTSEF
jgi:hypothetical protein